MIAYYCKICWRFIETQYEEKGLETGVQTVDKNTRACEKCTKDLRSGHPDHHFSSEKTHCKNGHLLIDTRVMKDVRSRVCKICMRMAEKRHREKNPGYHNKYRTERKKRENKIKENKIKEKEKATDA